MVTHFGGVGDTSMENPGTQDIDNVNEDDFQEILFRDYFTRQNI